MSSQPAQPQDPAPYQGLANPRRLRADGRSRDAERRAEPPAGSSDPRPAG